MRETLGGGVLGRPEGVSNPNKSSMSPPLPSSSSVFGVEVPLKCMLGKDDLDPEPILSRSSRSKLIRSLDLFLLDRECGTDVMPSDLGLPLLSEFPGDPSSVRSEVSIQVV